MHSDPNFSHGGAAAHVAADAPIPRSDTAAASAVRISHRFVAHAPIPRQECVGKGFVK